MAVVDKLEISHHDSEMQVETVYLTVGKSIAERRKQAGLTQERFARICGLSRASLANIECGLQNVYVHQLMAISDALSLGSIDALISKAPSASPDWMPSIANWCTPDELTESEMRQTLMIYTQTEKLADSDSIR